MNSIVVAFLNISMAWIFSKVFVLFVGLLCFMLVWEDTSEEQLEGIDTEAVHGKLHIGVVLED